MMQICGGPSLDYCSGSVGALCSLDLGKGKCGGQNYDGVVPISQKTAEKAEKAKEQLVKLLSSLEESMQKIGDVQQTARDTKDQARALQDRINKNMETFIKDKKKTQELAQGARAYLMDEMVPAKDINKMSRAVLTVSLPQSLDHIQSTVSDISSLLSKATNFLKNLIEDTRTTQDLLQKVQELRFRAQMKDIDVTDISRVVDETEAGWDKVNNELESASQDRKTTTERIQDIKDKLHKTVLKLMNRPPEDLQNDVETLRTKMVQNRETTRHAQQAAESALNTAGNIKMDLNNVMKQYDVLKRKKQNHTFHDETTKRLKSITDEVEYMKTQLEDKLTQILGLEQRIQLDFSRKQQKSDEVSSLLEIVESIHQEISRRAEGFAKCTS